MKTKINSWNVLLVLIGLLLLGGKVWGQCDFSFTSGTLPNATFGQPYTEPISPATGGTGIMYSIDNLAVMHFV